MSRSCESGGGQTGDGDLGSKSMGKEAIGAGLWRFNIVYVHVLLHMDEENILSGSGLDKDADGFHPLNVVICPSQEDNAEVVQVTSMFRDEAKIKDAHKFTVAPSRVASIILIMSGLCRRSTKSLAYSNKPLQALEAALLAGEGDPDL
ncbi:hypothetical protein VPH35_134634 [Triticum aestivum]|uniref:Uncharacterized protein n=1 Tax=Aegilops tauschii TaxID=37682 RepID=R7WAS8_AEGTA